mgnify:CR=1 FL=1
MKVIFVTLGFYPFRNSGFDVSGERFVRLLLEDGIKVTVLAGGNSRIRERYWHPNLTIIRLPFKKDNWIGYSLRAARLTNNLDGITHFWDVYLAYSYHKEFIATLHQSFRQRNEILSLQNINLTSLLLYRLYYSLARYLAEIPSLNRSRYLLAVSKTTMEEYKYHYNVDEKKILLARHYIDPDFFSKKRQVEQLRKRFGLSKDIPVLLFAGFINRRKGIEKLLEAIELVDCDVYLLIAGKWQSQNYRRLVFSKFSSTMKEKVIEIGFVPDDQMPYLYSLADIYVTTSLLEGFGLPIAESLACETPVIAVESGATREVLGPGGLLLPEITPLILANSIQLLIKDKELRQYLGKVGRNHVIQEFNKDSLLSSVYQAYRTLS